MLLLVRSSESKGARLAAGTNLEWRCESLWDLCAVTGTKRGARPNYMNAGVGELIVALPDEACQYRSRGESMRLTPMGAPEHDHR